MHKLIILGHPSSNYQDTFKLLQSYGVSEAKPARREGYTAHEITNIICQAHGVGDFQAANAEGINFNPINVGNVWHSLALDLMLGNLESKVWGWADTASVYLLNFWRDLDPETTFVLVYSNPEDVLLNNGQASNLTPEDLQIQIEQWIAYNEALLYFYNRNKERCFLVHSQQVHEPSNRSLLEIGTKINAPWLQQISEYADHEIEQSEPSENAENLALNQTLDKDYASIETQQADSAIAEVTHEIAAPINSLQQKPLPLFLSKLIIQQHPKLIQVYEELQSFANFPLNEQSTGFSKQNFNQSAFDAWLEMANYFSQLQQTEAEIKAATQKNQELITQLVQLEEIPKLAQEKDALVSQLHQVQEQLEEIYLDNKNLKSSESTYQKKLKELEDTQAKLNQMQAELKKLDALPELEQENSALLTQLHHVQEELERYYLENQAFKQEQNSKPKVLEYSAEQIKAQLPYRLGAAMIKHSKHIVGFICMPVILMQETRRYKQEKQNMPKTQKRSLSDYEKNQLTIVKNHLSYRLGSTLLANIRNPLKWLTLPFKLWQQINQFKKLRA